MTRDDVIRMAREAGASFETADSMFLFAELIAKHEREECAQVAERVLRHYTSAATGVAEAIRARGEQ